MIELRQVTKHAGGREPVRPGAQGERNARASGRKILDAVDLTIAPGEVVLLAGPSGSGKSKLLGLCYGACLPDAGTVAVFGRELSRLRRSSLVRLRRWLGVVPQTPPLLDDYSVLANVALALEIRGEPRQTMRQRAHASLDRVGLADRAATITAALSAVERQWVAIARALVTEPSVLIADEPSAHFDPDSRDRLIEIIAMEQGRGMAAILATNDHMLLCAGAHHGWRHIELRQGALEVIAERTAHVYSSEATEVDIDEYESIELVAVGDLDARTDDVVPNVVPFPRSASIGGASR